MDKVVMHLKQQPNMSFRHDIRTPIIHHQSNLPIVVNTCTKKELDTIKSHFKSAMVSFKCNSVIIDEFKYEFDSYSKM